MAMPRLRDIMRSAPVRRLATTLVAAYVRLIHATGRWQEVGRDIPQDYWGAGKPFIGCFWHGRLLMMPLAWPKGLTISMLISQHRDGTYVADLIARFGLGSIRGSTSKGGLKALRALRKALTGGQSVALTPDGPRGPRMRAGMGAVALAKITGLPILTATYAVSRRRLLGSWDHFVVPLPFCRGVYVWGQPIQVAADADEAALEAARQAVEDELNRITFLADRMVGQEPVPPADPVAAAP